MTYLRTGTFLTTLSLLATALASPALAQGGPGREGRLTYGVGLDYDFDDGLATTTDVAFAFTSRTATDTLTFGIGTQLYGDFTDSGTDDFSFRNRTANLGYARQGANSSLDFAIGYNETELDDNVDLSGPVPIITQDGRSATTRADFTLDLGTSSPFGLRFDARYRDLNYTNTTDPGLVDETEVGVDVLARFRLSPSSSLRARAGASVIDEDDLAGTERELTYFGIGYASQTASGLSFTGDLLYDHSKDTTTSPASTTTDDGIGVDISLSQPRPDGSVGASLSSRVDDTGRRTTARVSRSHNLPTGSVAYSLGVVDQEGQSSLEVVGDLNYQTQMASGSQLSLTLSQDVASSSGNPVVSTSAQLDFIQPINPVSSWRAGLSYYATDDQITQDERTTARIAYQRNLTPEWDMNTGYRYSKDDTGDVSNSVFFNVTRDITFGF